MPIKTMPSRAATALVYGTPVPLLRRLPARTAARHFPRASDSCTQSPLRKNRTVFARRQTQTQAASRDNEDGEVAQGESLVHFLMEQCPDEQGTDLAVLIHELGSATKRLADVLAGAGLQGLTGAAGGQNQSGDKQQKIDVTAVGALLLLSGMCSLDGSCCRFPDKCVYHIAVLSMS